MKMQTWVRIGLLGFAISSLGASCLPPDSLSTITFTNHGSGRTSTFIVPNFTTQGWDECSIGDEGNIDGQGNTTPSDVILKSSWPREAIAFDLSLTEATTDGEGSAWPYGPIQYATLPGPVAFGTVSREVPWNILSARVVDHGTCRGIIPWNATSPIYPKGFFGRLNDIIYGQTEQTLKSYSGALTLNQTFGRYQPSFQRPDCFQTSDQRNDDGFSLDLAYSVKWNGFPGGTVGIDASYKLGAADGWITVTRVPGADYCETGGVGSRSDPTVRNQVFVSLDDTAKYARQSLDDVASMEASIVQKKLASDPDKVFTLGDCTSDLECRTPGGFGAPHPVRDSFRFILGLALVGTGLDFDVAAARARILVDGTQDASYYCSGKPFDDAGQPGKKGCYWHPYVKRVTITPTALEVVYWDKDKPEPEPTDVEILKLLSPGIVDCTTGPTAPLGPAPIPITVTDSGESCNH